MNADPFSIASPGGQLSERNPSSAREEVEKLTWQFSEEVSKRVAKEMEIRDLQTKIRAIEGSVESSSAETLKLCQEKYELEETFAKFKEETGS